MVLPSTRTTPTTTSCARSWRKAIPSAKAISSGKAKTQNTASGSRRNSRSRALVSSTIGMRRGSGIAQVTPGEVHEDVFQGGAVRGQECQLRATLAEQVEQRRNGEVDFGRDEAAGGA